MAMTINTTNLDNAPPSPGSPLSPADSTTAATTAAAPASATDDSPKNPINSTTSNINTANNIKRKPSRRANTAERRATHNAVERQRRETLNSRFLDLAALLPNLSQIRRPSKSSIVNSSIAHIHASRRHRLLASRELRLVKAESDALRRELNEWRDRAGLPRVEEPMRSEAFAIVVNGEMDAMMVSAEMGAQHGMDEDEDGEDDWGMATNGGNPPSAYPSGEQDDLPPAPQQQQQQAPSGYAPQAGAFVSGPAPGYVSGPPPYPHHMQGYLEDDGRPTTKNGGSGGNPFAHNLPRGVGSPIVGYGEGGGANTLFTPPVSRDGPLSVVTVLPAGGGSNASSSVSGGASPAHSAHSQQHRHRQNGSVHSAGSPDERSGSGSPVGFVQQGPNRGRGSGSPSYELGYGYQQQQQAHMQHLSQQQQQQQHNGSLGGMMHGYGPGQSMGGGMPSSMGGMGYGGHGHHHPHHPQQHHHQGHPHHHPSGHGNAMVGVGAGAMGGVFGMML